MFAYKDHVARRREVIVVLFPVDRSIVDFDNDFSRRNPFYKQRAGAFYEIKYVAPAAESLFRIADVQAEQMPGTLDALRDFVYEWLDLYVRGNGTISQTKRAKCIAQMDERLDSLFDAPLQRKLYRVWRDDKSNELRFLMISPGVDKRDNNPATVPKDAGEQSKISFQRWLALVSRLSTLLTHPRFSAPKGCTPTELLSIIKLQVTLSTKEEYAKLELGQPLPYSASTIPRPRDER